VRLVHHFGPDTQAARDGVPIGMINLGAERQKKSSLDSMRIRSE
jgi:hypothetical protein